MFGKTITTTVTQTVTEKVAEITVTATATVTAVPKSLAEEAITTVRYSMTRLILYGLIFAAVGLAGFVGYALFVAFMGIGGRVEDRLARSKHWKVSKEGVSLNVKTRSDEERLERSKK